MDKKLRIFLGILIIILGVIGLFLPILQGIALIIVGVLMLEDKPIKFPEFIKLPEFLKRKK